MAGESCEWTAANATAFYSHYCFSQGAVVTDFETAHGFGFDVEIVAEEGVTVALYDRFNLHSFFAFVDVFGRALLTH